MNSRTAVLGGGVMGGTLAAAIKAGDVGDVIVVEQDTERAAALAAELDIEVGQDFELLSNVDVVLLAVKPQDLAPLLPAVADVVDPRAVVVSLAAGVHTATIEAVFGPGRAVVRAMPNTPAVIGEGMFGMSPGRSVTDEQLELVERLLSLGGRVVVVDESVQDAVTAVSGSGPAYVFYLAEQMIAAGLAEGLDRAQARALTEQTLLGAARLLIETGEAPEDLRARVTSPGGTTWVATSLFDELGVGEGLYQGIRAAAARSAELG